MSQPVRFKIKGTAVYVDAVPPGLRAQASADQSAYTTVGSGPRSRNWRAPGLGPNAALDYSADALRNQSRDQVRKNTLAAAAVERIVSNVVGTGIKPTFPNPDHQKLWNTWTDESAADGILDFYGQQGLSMSGVVTAGEVFVRLRTRLPQDGLSVPLQLELLESEFVPMDKNEAPQVNAAGVVTRGEIRQGIEFHPTVRSRRVAYWMYPRHPHDRAAGIVANDPVRVPASEVLHLYLPTRPGQLRGEPWMARTLARLKDLEAYDSAELVRKKVAAMFAGFIRRPVPEGLTLEDLAELYGEDAEIDGGIGLAGLEPGSMQVLKPGEEIEFSDPKDVGGMYEIYMRHQIRMVAASLGLLYEQLSGDFSQVNDRTWRAAVSEFRRRCESWQHHLMVFQFCRPVARRWAELAVISGAAKGLDPAAQIPWTPQRWAYINPLQDVQALEKEVQAGFTSRKRVVSERGDDAEQIDREQAEDNQRADGLELSHTSDGRRAGKDPQMGHNGGPPLEEDNSPAPGRQSQEK